jgi:hypothetical protein
MGRFRKDQLPDLIARIDKNLKSDKRIKWKQNLYMRNLNKSRIQ